MAAKVLLAGQSIMSNLWAQSGIATFSSELNSRTNQSVGIIQGAVGGSALLKAATQGGFPHLYWLDKDDGSSPLESPLRKVLEQDTSCVKAVAWAQGEQDGYVGVSTEAYLAGLVELQAILAGAAGKQPKDLPFVICPLGNAARIYTNAWKVRNAHLIAPLQYPGFFIGPEYIDLAVEADNIHLTQAARETFAVRLAAALAPILGVVPPQAGGGGAALQVKVKTFTRDISLASGSQEITGLGFQPKAVRVRALLNPTQYASWDGMDDGVTATCMYDYSYAEAGKFARNNSYSIYITSGANVYAGKIQSFDADGFTIAWAKTGSPGGTAEIACEAIG